MRRLGDDPQDEGILVRIGRTQGQRLRVSSRGREAGGTGDGSQVGIAIIVERPRVAGTSLEAAERRTALVGQLRFAVTLQDLRTVLVLRRQLAQERPRSRPWIRGTTRPARWPIVRRGVRSVLRWPASRVVRVVGLSIAAGFALRGVWAGTTPLVVAAGLALWVAALDAVEPLGQEVDHPGRTDGFPIERGRLHVGHLPR